MTKVSRIDNIENRVDSLMEFKTALESGEADRFLSDHPFFQRRQNSPPLGQPQHRPSEIRAPEGMGRGPAPTPTHEQGQIQAQAAFAATDPAEAPQDDRGIGQVMHDSVYGGMSKEQAGRYDMLNLGMGGNIKPSPYSPQNAQADRSALEAQIALLQQQIEQFKNPQAGQVPTEKRGMM